MLKIPDPLPAIVDPALSRPDWTKSDARSPARLWLDKNENSDPALAAVVADVVAGVGREMQYAYPDAAPVYAKLARSIGFSPDSLIFGHGSDGLIRAVFEAFVAPGDTVIHTTPTFAMYSVYSRMFGARAIAVPYAASQAGPMLEADTLVEAIRREAPRAVFLPNPDSPTGTVFGGGDLRRIVRAAADAGAVMLIDEAYFHFHPESALYWVRDNPHLFVVRSTGKAWGMAGFRIGWGAAMPELVRTLHKVKGMYEANTFGLAVFSGMLDHMDAVEASVTRLQAGKAAFCDTMEKLGFRVLRGAGNFCHVAFAGHAESIHAALADTIYYRKDFVEPCLKGFSRFSSTTPELIRPVIERIQRVVQLGK